jgi:peptidoglycan-associated lipoprotein
MRSTRLIATALVLALASGCAGSRAKKDKKEGKDAAANKGPEAPYNPSVDVTEASLRGDDFVATADLSTIYFDYDSFSLKQSALDALKRNAAYLKDHRDVEVLVAGHCDERGTIEYNLALGQKRAKEVREYYIRLGVDGKAVATISYGREKPNCAESTEECWSKNRRAETLARAKK